MNIPVNTDGYVILCGGLPEPVIEYGTGVIKTDATGAPLNTVQLVLLLNGRPEVVPVKVAGTEACAGLSVGAPVKVADLMATTWEMADRSGISFRATSIKPLQSASGSGGGAGGGAGNGAGSGAGAQTGRSA